MHLHQIVRHVQKDAFHHVEVPHRASVQLLPRVHVRLKLRRVVIELKDRVSVVIRRGHDKAVVVIVEAGLLSLVPILEGDVLGLTLLEPEAVAVGLRLNTEALCRLVVPVLRLFLGLGQESSGNGCFHV